MAAAIFAELCQRFELADVVKDKILDLGITSLSEFRFFVASSDELEGLFVTPIRANLENPRIQLARYCCSWEPRGQSSHCNPPPVG